MGKGFVSENTIRHSRSDLGFRDISDEDLNLPGGGGDLKVWRLAGMVGFQLSF